MSLVYLFQHVVISDLMFIDISVYILLKPCVHRLLLI